MNKLLYRGLAHVCVAASLVCAASPALAWKPGLNAESWTKGATLFVFVDDIPANAPAGTSQAVDDAIKSWNDAQAPYGGLKLVRAGATKDNADIHIIWNDKTKDWGDTNKKDGVDKKNGFTKETVRMMLRTSGKSGKLDADGVKALVTHELGHAEGLAHSKLSDVDT